MAASTSDVVEEARHSIGSEVSALDTPVLLLDRAAFERNLARMAAECRALGKALRPHVKAHKSPIVAQRQLEAGAVGVTCAKVGEAEVMVAGGVRDVLVSTVVGSARKAERLCTLATTASVATVVDSAAGAHWLSAAANAAGVRIDVLVDVNVGQDRTGVEPGAAGDLASLVSTLPGLRYRGVQGYEGHLQHVYDLAERARRVDAAMERLGAATASVAAAGHPAVWVTTGGTGTFRLSGARSFVTELQPGSYAVMDADYGRVEGQAFEVALSVLTTVLGTYAGRAVVDAGSKTMSTDAGQPVPKALAGLTFTTAGDEHGKLLPGGADPAALHVGSTIELLPSHCDTTVNLHEVLYVVSDGVVQDVWPIEARGRVR